MELTNEEQELIYFFRQIASKEYRDLIIETVYSAADADEEERRQSFRKCIRFEARKKE